MPFRFWVPVLQQDNYEKTAYMPPERAEDMAQLNLGVHFLRLGAWDDHSVRSGLDWRVYWYFYVHYFMRKYPTNHTSFFKPATRVHVHPLDLRFVTMQQQDLTKHSAIPLLRAILVYGTTSERLHCLGFEILAMAVAKSEQR